MTPAQFARYLSRDEGRCLHCGTTEGLVPQHRKNRGMGGRESLDVPSNVLTLCSGYNGLLEADGHAANVGRAMGWKLLDWQDPLVLPVFDRISGSWFYLDDDYHRTPAAPAYLDDVDYRLEWQQAEGGK